jgi:hypothetical protein
MRRPKNRKSLKLFVVVPSPNKFTYSVKYPAFQTIEMAKRYARWVGAALPYMKCSWEVMTIAQALKSFSNIDVVLQIKRYDVTDVSRLIKGRLLPLFPYKFIEDKKRVSENQVGFSLEM